MKTWSLLVSIAALLFISIPQQTHAQEPSSTNTMPRGGEYSVQSILSECDDRFNANNASRFVAEAFWLDDDGDLRIGNENRNREYRATEQPDVFTSEISGGPYRTITLLSDTLFTELTVFSDDSPCNMLQIYTFARSEIADQDAMAGIPLPLASADIGVGYRVSRTRTNCTFFPNGFFNSESLDVNFKLQDDGRILVAQYGDIEGYATGTYYVQTPNPSVYIHQREEAVTIITLRNSAYFEREIYYVDGCVLEDAFILPERFIFGEADDNATVLLGGGDGDTESDAVDDTGSVVIALPNGFTLISPPEWGASGVTDAVFLFFNDDTLSREIVIRAVINQQLVFGFNDYDPATVSPNEIITAYYQATPPNRSMEGVEISETTVSGFPALRGEQIVEGVSRQIIVVDTDSGRVGLAITVETAAQDTWQPIIDDIVNSLSTERAIDGPPQFMVELSTGDVLNTENSDFEFVDFQNYSLLFSADGTIGETLTVTLYPETPFTTTSYELQTADFGDLVRGAAVALPFTIDDTLYTAIYADIENGLLNIETDGVSIDGTFEFTARLLRIDQGFNLFVTPDNLPPLPESVTVSGSFSNIVPPPREQ
jgi:hypothetical protein